MLTLRAGFWILAPVAGALAGLVYGLAFDIEPLVSAMRGAFIGAPVLLYERGVLLRRWRDLIRRAATPVFGLATLATYIGMIVLGNAVAGTILHRGFGYMANAQVAMRMSETGFAYALGISALATFVLRVRDLMGPRVFASLLVGRYHRAITEERIFLFLDVAGSTRFAEEHGDLAAQVWLGAIFAALAAPVRRSQGSIDDYIGDMALVSWSMDRGLRNAACLDCVFDFLRLVEADAERWTARFGQVPTFRAAIHCGPVVTAEIGLERRKIAYFGDTLNTTSRLEGLAKELGAGIVVSGDLLDRLAELPPHMIVSDLGLRPLRGRKEPLRIAAVRTRERVGSGL
ncbi:adenylate/guanylate cyclase domain-containing protein [Methylobacterium sp. SyP6R]|uniref:adenylate/guanylate cyclase domain-containing protein n=1 Tax=Methylobacterium sp. SyP6R TaxID=2718876 RepID=UPI001F45BCBC|nr:adenylate/guanylate cyclase domain-containing protein [Methylobacterium sp. SyP6R]MCF4127516.1 adenylate/guanylate cyclase domain-containing protein [Methylobacterium sp. SyP6R]